MQKNNPPRFPRYKSIILLWGAALFCILLVTVLSVLLSLPTDSVANVGKDAYPFADTAVFLSAVVIPITFLVVLLTRPKRDR